MTPEQETVKHIKAAIATLPPAEREQCNELADWIRLSCRRAGPVVGNMALALVGAEAQVEQ